MTEVLLAMAANAQVVVCIAGGFFLISAAIKFIHSDVEHIFEKVREARGKRSARRTAIIGLLCFSVLIIPTIEDMWRVRIGLIKFNLASPENVKQGAEVIERIGRKLECEYLGCSEKAAVKE